MLFEEIDKDPREDNERGQANQRCGQAVGRQEFPDEVEVAIHDLEAEFSCCFGETGLALDYARNSISPVTGSYSLGIMPMQTTVKTGFPAV
jgi:hypothetical protein